MRNPDEWIVGDDIKDEVRQCCLQWNREGNEDVFRESDIEEVIANLDEDYLREQHQVRAIRLLFIIQCGGWYFMNKRLESILEKYANEPSHCKPKSSSGVWEIRARYSS